MRELVVKLALGLRKKGYSLVLSSSEDDPERGELLLNLGNAAPTPAAPT